MQLGQALQAVSHLITHAKRGCLSVNGQDSPRTNLACRWIYERLASLNPDSLKAN